MHLIDRLAEPFDPRCLEWRPGNIQGPRCLALPYLDARAVMDRLDAVLGSSGWQDGYKPLPGGCVLCKLHCLMDSRWVVKMDVGSPSQQPDEGDRMKAAVTDALKRTAVKFGIGRYLYRLPRVWVDYDPRTRQLTPPELPDWAMPWITDLEAEGLRDLLETTGTDLERFLTHLEIERVEHLPRHRLAATTDLLNKKKTKQLEATGPVNGSGPGRPAGKRK